LRAPEEPAIDWEQAILLSEFVVAWRRRITRGAALLYLTRALTMSNRITSSTQPKPVSPDSSGKAQSSPAKAVLDELNKSNLDTKVSARNMKGMVCLHIRNQDSGGIGQRISDFFTGAHVARRVTTARAVEELLSRFDKVSGAQPMLKNIRAEIHNYDKTLTVGVLKNSLQVLADLEDKANAKSASKPAPYVATPWPKEFFQTAAKVTPKPGAAQGRKTAQTELPVSAKPDESSKSMLMPELKRFAGMNATEVATFSRATGISDKRISAMQGYLKHQAESPNGETAGKPRSLQRVAGFAMAFETWIRQLPQALANPDIQALQAEVKAFAVAHPERMGPDIAIGD
jgi:hypothetical protein